MASAQVLPSSRKQEHLEAGKRKLEEFRKKKAAERAKKAVTSNQHQASNAGSDQTDPLEAERIRLTESGGAGTSDGPGRTLGTSSLSSNNSNIFDIAEKVERSPLKNADANPPSTSDYNAERQTNNHDFKRHDASVFDEASAVNYVRQTNDLHRESGIYSGSHDQSVVSHPQASQGFDSSYHQSGRKEMDSFPSKEDHGPLNDSAILGPGSHIFTSSQYSAKSQLQMEPVQPNSDFRGSSLEVEADMRDNVHSNGPMNSRWGQNKFSSSASGFPSVHDTALQTPESTVFNSDIRSSLDQVPSYLSSSESISTKRTRPSFLDSLNLRKTSFETSIQHTEPQNKSFFTDTSKSNGMGFLGSSAFQKPLFETETARPFSMLQPSSTPSAVEHYLESSVSSSNGVDLPRLNVNENGIERKHEFYLPKQNEDFSALEQHIEDLTQEKFSLQRALEASRTLSESLATENSSLTDTYNQQRNVVNELKSDMERLQEEIKAHLVELESVKIEYANAQLECNAADERAKLLASEVIGLEEKALRLRSNELKLERELEKSHAEITSYKRKMSSLEEDRQDLQSTIDALQEEKKLLQFKLQKASASGKSIDVNKSPKNTKDRSTSTEDLDSVPETSTQETHDVASLPGSDHPVLSVLPESGQFGNEVAHIPSDQLRTIHNINALISELALEKEELMRALASESSQCSKLKDLNKELSRKLEAQTQRLELLTAQSMANENISTRLADSRNMQESNTYADEGDEVVERVLGWIMKLFPGGPSRRRTSKLL